ncbi:YukJ family protein [Paenibacillus sp. JNUCC31]|uniref:YukJ family protein n=1 Tax=Paenibacillus sp. JNUCC-31 TaxID=2777983 RepID=UPI0017862EF0|nr:YukJ family protein [Paenibacillus sp. JNUCC-31]QOS80061.1 YukJ family protein [Paenibacillus sp. JNUCC-31]
MGKGLDNGYGVLKCKLADVEKVYVPSKGTNHVEVLVIGDSHEKFRLAINIQSSVSPRHLSEDTANQVLYYVGEDFSSEEITHLPDLQFGFTEITKGNRNIALDFIRGNLVIPNKMVFLPNTDPENSEDNNPDNDLYDKVTSYIEEAKQKNATLYVFGEPWGPEKNKPDKYFDFEPGRGIHNIHMNQGNAGKYAKENGSWQDGGVLIHHENENRWVAIFLAFQSQSWCTNDKGDATKPVSECDHISCEANKEKAEVSC